MIKLSKIAIIACLFFFTAEGFSLTAPQAAAQLHDKAFFRDRTSGEIISFRPADIKSDFPLGEEFVAVLNLNVSHAHIEGFYIPDDMIIEVWASEENPNETMVRISIVTNMPGNFEYELSAKLNMPGAALMDQQYVTARIRLNVSEGFYTGFIPTEYTIVAQAGARGAFTSRFLNSAYFEGSLPLTMTCKTPFNTEVFPDATYPPFHTWQEIITRYWTNAQDSVGRRSCELTAFSQQDRRVYKQNINVILIPK